MVFSHCREFRCFYANDEHFRYCENCGYARVQVEGALAGDRVRIDQDMIAGRLDELAKQRARQVM